MKTVNFSVLISHLQNEIKPEAFLSMVFTRKKKHVLPRNWENYSKKLVNLLLTENSRKRVIIINKNRFHKKIKNKKADFFLNIGWLFLQQKLHKIKNKNSNKIGGQENFRIFLLIKISSRWEQKNSILDLIWEVFMYS